MTLYIIIPFIFNYIIPIISQQFSIHIPQLDKLTQTWQKIQQEQLWPGLARNWFEACLLGHATGLAKLLVV